MEGTRHRPTGHASSPNGGGRGGREAKTAAGRRVVQSRRRARPSSEPQAARRRSEIGGVVAHVPSGLVHGGIQAGGDPSVRPPAWTRAGEPIAGAPMAFQEIDFTRQPVRFGPGFLGGLRDETAVAEAKIPVENIRCPVLLFSGRDDQLWPSPILAKIAEDGLTSATSVEHIAYDDAGHNIGHPYLPTTTHSLVHPLNGLEIDLGGTDAGDAHARADSWRRALKLLAGI